MKKTGLLVIMIGSMSISACLESTDEAKCAGVTCNTPPTDACLDDDTLTVYEAEGQCDPDTGECTYPSDDVECDHGCAQGRCLDDLCADVVCDDPPANACKDDTTLFVYPATGTCDPLNARCVYQPEELVCETSCENGMCDADPCAGVNCDDPPANECKDAAVLFEYPETGVCDPATGECGYEPEEVICDSGCLDGACDLGDDFAILSPPGSAVCTQRNHWELIEVLQGKGRLTYKEGLFRLPRDGDGFELDLIESIELGPDGRSPTAIGPGVVTRTVQGDPGADATYRYTFRQEFDDGGEVLTITIEATFRVVDDECDAPVASVDDQDLLYQRCYTDVEAFGTSLDQQVHFVTCQYDYPGLWSTQSVEVDMHNGDKLRFEARMSFKCCCYIGFDYAELIGASFERGDTTREVSDFFGLALSTRHHVFGQSYLVVLDPPVDEVHGLLMMDSDWPDPTVDYLGADLQPIATPAVDDIRVTTDGP